MKTVFYILLFFSITDGLFLDSRNTGPPRLCSTEDKEKTIYSELHSDVTLSICVISSSEVSVSGFSARNKNQTVPRHKSHVWTLQQRDHAYRVKIKMFDIQKDDFGTFTVQLFTSGSKGGKLEYVFVLKETVLNFTLVKSNNSQVLNESLTLSCESNAHHPSSLTITALDRNLQMRTDVQDNALQYHIARLQCEDMGTYICHYDKNTSHWKNLTVAVRRCPPQLCPGEDKDKTIYSDLHSNVTFSICVISSSEVSVSGLSPHNENQTVPRHNPEVLILQGREHEYRVMIEMFDVRQDDFGPLILQLDTLGSKKDKLEYVFVLKKTETLLTTSITEATETPLTTSMTPRPETPLYDKEDSTGSLFIDGVIALVVTCIICIILAVIIYRFRDRLCRCHDRESTPVHTADYITPVDPVYHTDGLCKCLGRESPIDITGYITPIEPVYHEAMEMDQFLNVDPRSKVTRTERNQRPTPHPHTAMTSSEGEHLYEELD